MFKRKHFLPSILLLIISVSITSCMFTQSKAKRLYDKASTKKYDIIVVPGIPLQNGQWDSIMKGRVYWAKFLYDKGITKNIMFSGSSVYSPYYEGEVMALYAIALGVPKENVFTETKAEHSTENLYYGYYKSKQLGFKMIALATDPFQGKQLSSYAKLRLNRDIGIIPFVIDSLKSLWPVMIHPVIDYQKAYNKDFVDIKERESGWKRFKGTMSWNIDHKAYR